MSDWDDFDFFKEEKKPIIKEEKKDQKGKKEPKKKKKSIKKKTKLVLKKQVHKQMPIKTYTKKMTKKKDILYIEEIKIKKPDEFTDEDIELVIKSSITQDKLSYIKNILFLQRPLPKVTLSTKRHLKKEILPLLKRIFAEA